MTQLIITFNIGDSSDSRQQYRNHSDRDIDIIYTIYLYLSDPKIIWDVKYEKGGF